VSGDHASLVDALTRLKLTASRDQLDSLLDEATKRELSLREALAFLVEREIARKDERRVEMAVKIAHFPTVRDLDSFDFAAQPSLGRSATWPLAAGWRMARRCCWGRPASARPIWRLRSAARRSTRAIRCCS
jgi:DNA replication protein DnaC